VIIEQGIAENVEFVLKDMIIIAFGLGIVLEDIITNNFISFFFGKLSLTLFSISPLPSHS